MIRKRTARPKRDTAADAETAGIKYATDQLESEYFINWVGDPTDKISVRPGGAFILIAPDATGYAVTAATGDLLKIANSAGTTSVTYDIIIIGATS